MDEKRKNIIINALDSSSGRVEKLLNILRVTNTLFESSDSSSSDDDSYTNTEPKKTTAYYDFVAIIDMWNAEDFKFHMRLTKTTVDFLIEKHEQYDPSNIQKGIIGHSKMSSKKYIYMFLWYITNTASYSEMANLFGASKSTALRVIRSISSWLTMLGNEFIRWPLVDEINDRCRRFEELHNIPNVIGVLDCTHIIIEPPLNHKQRYLNTQKSYSIILQAVVDVDQKFINIHCGEEGSRSKRRVLRRSDFYQKTEKYVNCLFPSSTCLLGDTAYIGSKWLITPFKDELCLTELQKKFNHVHASARQISRKTFELLKGRFKRLTQLTGNKNLAIIKNIIISACILHNMDMDNDDGHDKNKADEESGNAIDENCSETEDEDSKR